LFEGRPEEPPSGPTSAFQIDSKFSQIQPSSAKFQQNGSKKIVLISLDFLVGIEPFQWVVLIPGIFSFLAKEAY
jgi:hypothetical protein